MPKELAATLEIRDEIEIGVCLETKFQADQKWTLEGTLENLAFANSMCHFLLRDDLLLGEDFHCVDSLGVPLADLEDLAESASANQLQEFKIARGESTFGLKGRRLIKAIPEKENREGEKKTSVALEAGNVEGKSLGSRVSLPEEDDMTLEKKDFGVEMMCTLNCSYVIWTRISPLTISSSKGRSLMIRTN